jgi:hypothetical protein
LEQHAPGCGSCHRRYRYRISRSRSRGIHVSTAIRHTSGFATSSCASCAEGRPIVSHCCHRAVYAGSPTLLAEGAGDLAKNMSRVLKKLLLVALALFGLAIALFFYSVRADQRQFRAAANPCERDCLQDSGGLEGCRKECASHPTTYGPASQQR